MDRIGSRVRDVSTSFHCMLLLFLGAAGVNAQERPFFFTIAPPSPAVSPLLVHCDVAYGKGTFEPIGGGNAEQTVGMRAAITPSVAVTGAFGLATAGATTTTSQQLEMMVHLVRSTESGFDLSLGSGVRREYAGTKVLLGRIIAGRRFTQWQVYGNMLLEKPFAADRDAVDLLLTAGWSYRIAMAVSVGLEAVGQDLEGFWDEEEAEGGATLFVGPTIAVAIPGSNAILTVGAGPILKGSTSDRLSTAVREFPVTQENGYIVRAAVNVAL